MWRVDSLEKTLMLGGIGGRRRRGWPRMGWLDGIADSMDVSLSKLQEIQWRMGKPGVLQFMGSQRVGHDWGTEQQQQICILGDTNIQSIAGDWKWRKFFLLVSMFSLNGHCHLLRLAGWAEMLGWDVGRELWGVWRFGRNYLNEGFKQQQKSCVGKQEMIIRLLWGLRWVVGEW